MRRFRLQKIIQKIKKDVIRDNGPRIVGAMKLVPDVLLFKSGLQDTGNSRFRSAAATGFIASRLLLLGFGSKDRKKDPNQPESPYKDDPTLIGKLKYNLHKVMHPNQYPVEAGAGVAAAAGVSVGLSGIAQMRKKATFKEGLTELGVGIFTALAEGNVLFGKEKKAADKKDANKENKDGGIIQKFKDQPVLLSGVIQAVASGAQIAIGLMTLSRRKKEAVETKETKGKNWYYLAAASIYTAADLIYAFFVRKNEFNSENKDAPVAEKPAQIEHNAVPETTRKLNWQQSVEQSKDTQLAIS